MLHTFQPPSSKYQFSVVIPAAGIGSRMASKKAKQYLQLHDKTILAHTLEVFLSQPWINNVVVALHPDDKIFATLDITKNPKIHSIIGGKERVDSVLAGLHYIQKIQPINSDQQQFVLVHDAARPCLQTIHLEKLICNGLKAIETGQACGAILASPVVDTVKRADINKANNIDSSINRDGLWLAQTPQMFDVQELSKAIESNIDQKHLITDEASAMEMCNKKVLLVNAPTSNIKVTRPEDLALAEFYLQAIRNVSAS